MTQEQIDMINSKCPYGQGIFVEPNGIPIHIKEPVIYSRYVKSGYRGGSCYGDTIPYRFTNEVPTDHMLVLDLVLEELCPKITYLQFKKTQSVIHNNEQTEYEYYGNSTDWYVEYIILSEPDCTSFVDGEHLSYGYGKMNGGLGTWQFQLPFGFIEKRMK